MPKHLFPAAFIIAYPLLAHLSILYTMPYLQIVAMIIFLLGMLWSALIRASVAALLLFMAMSGCVLILGYLHLTLFLLYVPPILIPLTLMLFFGRTLLPGNEPLITAIGEATRGPLSRDMRSYTRRLTQLWCVVFLVMMLWSAVLPWLHSPELWSWFTNVINYGVIGVLLVGEFIVRKKLFPEHDHPTFVEYLCIVTHANIRR